MAALEAEIARQAAASGVRDVGGDAGLGHQRAVGVEAQHRMLVTVRLHQRLGVQLGRLPAGGEDELGERVRGFGGLVRPRIVGQQFVRVAAQHRGAAGFQPNDGGARIEVRGQRRQRRRQPLLRRVQLAGGNPRQPAAHRLVGQHHLIAGRLEHRDGGLTDLRGKVIGEAVRPQQHLPLRAGGDGAGGEPRRERLLGELRDLAFLGDAAEAFDQRSARQPVGQLGRLGCDPRPQRQPAHRPVRQRPRPRSALVVVVGEFGLVGGHVDVDRAVRQTPFARQAQIERVAHLGGAPPVGHHVALQHLPQQMRAPAGGVLLLAGGLIARAHHPAAGLAALADAHAAALGLGEVAVVVRIGEQRQRLSLQRRLMADVGVQRRRIHHHTGVEHPARIPDVLHAGHQRQPVVAVHPAQHLRAGPAVAVLPGHRPAQRHHQIGGLLDERPVGADAVLGEQIEVDAHVHAALTEVPVGRPGQPVAGHQRVQATQVVGQPVRRHRGVLPAAPGLGAVGATGGQPGGVGATPPQHRLRRRLGDQRRRGRRPRILQRHQHFLGGHRRRHQILAAHLDQHPGPPGGQPGVDRRAAHLAGQPVDELIVDRLHRQRAVRQHRRHAFGRGDRVAEPQHAQHPRGRQRCQRHRRAQRRSEPALAAAQQRGDVVAVFGQQLVQRVAGDLAGELPEPPPDHRLVRVDESGEVAVQLPLRTRQRRQRLAVAVGGERGAGAVGEQHLQRAHVVGGGAPRHRMRAARVVGDHPAERGAAGRGRVGAERQLVRFGRGQQVGEHHPGFDERGPRGGVDVEDVVDVARRVDHHAADRVARHRGTAAAHHDRGSCGGRQRDRGGQVVDVFRHHDQVRHHPVIGRVSGIQSPGGRVVVHRAANLGTQLGPQPPDVVGRGR